MAHTNYLFTSESVSEGHPDKVCDRISDTIVDIYLGADPQARVAVETLCTTNKVVLAGEVRGPASITHDKLKEAARAAIKALTRTPHTRNAGWCVSSPIRPPSMPSGCADPIVSVGVRGRCQPCFRSLR